MWKDFFYFSRGQRAGIIILIFLILLAIVTNYLLPIFFPITEKNDSKFQTEVLAFKKSLVSRDSVRRAQWELQKEERQRQFEEKYQNNYTSYLTSKKDSKKESYVLSTFDPNTIDSSGFVKLGLKPFIASNILKYRKSGAKFRTPADFSRVYGILPEKFKELEPYISIAEITPLKNEYKTTKRSDIIVDLNSADTSLLMQVKGIGRGYAKGIVRFRQTTGGFISVDQLSEVYGMHPENVDKIRPFCVVNLSLVQKIKINTASVDRLKSHPYIGFYRAKAIYEFRRRKGVLNNLNELRDLPELSADDLNKLKPYLSFE